MNDKPNKFKDVLDYAFSSAAGTTIKNVFLKSRREFP